MAGIKMQDFGRALSAQPTQPPVGTDPQQWFEVQRRAALAQMLQEGALSPIGSGIGRAGPGQVQAKISPWEGIAKLGEALLARNAVKGSLDEQAKLITDTRNRGLKAFQDAISPGGGAPESAVPFTPTQSSMGGDSSGSAVGYNPSSTQYAPPVQAPPSYGQRALGAYIGAAQAGLPEGVAQAALEPYKPTEEMRNYQWQNIGPDLARQMTLNKATQSFRPGSLIKGADGSLSMAPADGMQFSVDPSGKVSASQIAGYAPANAAIRGAQKTAEEAATPRVIGTDKDGRTIYGYAPPPAGAATAAAGPVAGGQSAPAPRANAPVSAAAPAAPGSKPDAKFPGVDWNDVVPFDVNPGPFQNDVDKDYMKGQKAFRIKKDEEMGSLRKSNALALNNIQEARHNLKDGAITGGASDRLTKVQNVFSSVFGVPADYFGDTAKTQELKKNLINFALFNIKNNPGLESNPRIAASIVEMQTELANPSPNMDKRAINNLLNVAEETINWNNKHADLWREYKRRGKGEYTDFDNFASKYVPRIGYGGGAPGVPAGGPNIPSADAIDAELKRRQATRGGG